MKPLTLILKIVALVCFILHTFVEGRPVPATATASWTRPGLFLGVGLGFWVLSEIVTAF